MIFGKLITEPNINESYDCAEEAYNIIRETYIQESSIFESVLCIDFAEAAFNNGTITEARMISIQETSIKEAGTKLLAMIKAIGANIATLFINFFNRVRALFEVEGKAILLKYDRNIMMKFKEDPDYYKKYKSKTSDFKFMNGNLNELDNSIRDAVTNSSADTTIGATNTTSLLTDAEKEDHRNSLANAFLKGSTYATLEDDFIKNLIGEEIELEGVSLDMYAELRKAITTRDVTIKRIKSFEVYYSSMLKEFETKEAKFIQDLAPKDTDEDMSKLGMALHNNATVFSIISEFSAKVIGLYSKENQIVFDDLKKEFAKMNSYKPDKAEKK